MRGAPKPTTLTALKPPTTPTLTVLADSGPFVALYNNRDKHHQRALDFFRVHGAALRLHTTWEVISEVMYFLDFSAAVQGDFLDWLYAGHNQGLVTIAALQPDELPDLATMMRKYADQFLYRKRR